MYVTSEGKCHLVECGKIAFLIRHNWHQTQIISTFIIFWTFRKQFSIISINTELIITDITVFMLMMENCIQNVQNIRKNVKKLKNTFIVHQVFWWIKLTACSELRASFHKFYSCRNFLRCISSKISKIQIWN